MSKFSKLKVPFAGAIGAVCGGLFIYYERERLYGPPLKWDFNWDKLVFVDLSLLHCCVTAN